MLFNEKIHCLIQTVGSNQNLNVQRLEKHEKFTETFQERRAEKSARKTHHCNFQIECAGSDRELFTVQRC